MRDTVLPLTVRLALAAGCSFSASSESSSDSVRSAAASNTSSSPDSREQAYRDDVRDYTESYLKSGGQFDAYQRHLGAIARKDAITNWEESEVTSRAWRYQSDRRGVTLARAPTVTSGALAGARSVRS